MRQKRKQRRAEFFAEPRATRGTWEVRALYQNDGPDNRASRRERLALAIKAYRAGEWVVELGRAIRARSARGPKGIVPDPKPDAENTWTFAEWPVLRCERGQAVYAQMHSLSRSERAL